MVKGLDGNTTRNASYAILLIFAATTGVLFWRDVPIGNKETLNHVISTLENVLLIVAGFLFGSSMGSRAKDKPEIVPDGGAVQTTQTETTKVETETRRDSKPPQPVTEMKL